MDVFSQSENTKTRSMLRSQEQCQGRANTVKFGRNDANVTEKMSRS